MQKVMTATTSNSSVRDEIIGWDFEDGYKVIAAFCEKIGSKEQYQYYSDIPINKVRSAGNDFDHYPTILHALADNWKLLAPPARYVEMIDGEEREYYEWWLVRD